MERTLSGSLQRVAAASANELPGEVDPLITAEQVEALTSIRKSARAALIAQGKFPRPVLINSRNVRWRLSSIRQWINQLPVAEERAA